MRASRLWRAISRLGEVLVRSIKAQIEGLDVNFYIPNEGVCSSDVELRCVAVKLRKKVKYCIEKTYCHCNWQRIENFSLSMKEKKKLEEETRLIFYFNFHEVLYNSIFRMRHVTNPSITLDLAPISVFTNPYYSLHTGASNVSHVLYNFIYICVYIALVV